MDEPHHVGLVRATLSSMHVEEYDESVIQQLLELLYRHVHKTSATAITIARHCRRESANEEDVKLAIRMHRPFGKPSHLMVKEIAREVNKQPFAQASSKPGIELPKERALTTRNYDVVISRNRAPGPWPELFPPVVRPRRRKPRNTVIQRRIKLSAPTQSTTCVPSSTSTEITADKRVITGSRAQAISIMRSPFTANATQMQAATVPTMGRPFKTSARVNTATHANMPEPPPLSTPIQERPAPDTRFRAAIPKTAFELDTSLLNHHASKRAAAPKTVVESVRQQASKAPTPVPAQAPRTPPRSKAPDRTRTTEFVPQIASRLRPNMLAPSEPRPSIHKAQLSVRPIRPRTPEPIQQQVRGTAPEITHKKAIGKMPKLRVSITKRPAPRIASSDSDDFSDLVKSMPLVGSAFVPTRKSRTRSMLAVAREIQESSSDEEKGDANEETEQSKLNVSNANHPKKLKMSPFTGPRKSSAWLQRDAIGKPVQRDASNNDSPITRREKPLDGSSLAMLRRDNAAQIANRQSGQRTTFGDNIKRTAHFIDAFYYPCFFRARSIH